MKEATSTGITVKSIYFAALDIADQADRKRFLTETCDGNAALKIEVEALLAAHEYERSSDFSRFVGDMNSDAPAEHKARSLEQTLDFDRNENSSHPVIDRYKLLEEIGRGGMGTVYMAQQTEPVKRRVALKVINPGMDSREVIARFEAERQALAMMDHANIARVFDGGTTAEGRPYFVMELVRGVPITEYCEKHQIDLAARLQLFIDVCKAVQHAHQKGIIHRDLKPSNVQITNHDGDPIVKIIDFGVAKALHHDLTDRTLYTQFNQLVGTPLYMSPEQADRHGSDVDTRSDVYSLGVLLYELLTGTTPFDREELSQAGVDGARRMICEVEPPRPSVKVSTLKASDDSTLNVKRDIDRHKLQSQIRGDLDWIVMKSLEKKRDDRYESASALAKDIQRHLDNEPIEAKPPTTFTRVTKWTRRHSRILFPSAAFLTLASLAFATWWGAQLAMQAAVAREVERDLEQAENAIESGQLELAKSQLAESRGTAQQLSDAAVPLIAKIDRLNAELDRYSTLSALYQRARQRRSREPVVRQKLYDALALYGFPGEEGSNDLHHLQDVPRSLANKVKSIVYELLVLLAYDRLLWLDDFSTEAEKLQVINDSKKYLEQARELHAPTKGYYWVMATCYQRMGDRTEGAVREYNDQEALRLRALAAATPPQNAAELFYIVRDRRWGCADQFERAPFRWPISPDEQIAAYQEILRLEPDYKNALFFMAIKLADQERFEEAVQAWNGILASDPNDWVALGNRAESLAKIGRLKESLTDHERAVELGRRIHEANPKLYGPAETLESYAEVLASQGKLELARGKLEEAVQIMQTVVEAAPDFENHKSRLKDMEDRLTKLEEEIATEENE